jgi:hypothetical protein
MPPRPAATQELRERQAAQQEVKQRALELQPQRHRMR